MSERFTLTILPDGSALLTTPRDLTERQVAEIRRAFVDWRQTPKGVAIVANTDIQHATSVDIDLPVKPPT